VTTTTDDDRVWLTRINVRGLLGHFNHIVDFPSDDPFVILHGPNGVGKTHLLRLTHAVLSRRYGEISTIRFDVAIFQFTNDVLLEIRNYGDRHHQDQLELIENGGRSASKHSGNDLSIEFILQVGNQDPLRVRPRYSEDNRRYARSLLEHESGLERIGFENWYDTASGMYLSTEQALFRYFSDHPIVRDAFIDSQHKNSPMRRIDRILSQVSSKLVETQRLLNANDIPRSSRVPERQARPTVIEYAEDLARQISNKLAENSRISSKLDRTFPKRVLSKNVPEPPQAAALIARYDQQSSLRNRLSEVSLLVENEQDISIDINTELDATERRVLSIYLDDAEQKLATFQNLLDRVTLLRNIINARFLFKTLEIDQEKGLVFNTDYGERIEPSDLSSGEQHELILLYALLFRTTPGAIVLIDEPEISLHVKWQRSFLDDLSEISQLVDLRFIIATHSPQIVNTWHSKTVRLMSSELES
jgi:predicted ATP-binding protein involved in virulence